MQDKSSPTPAPALCSLALSFSVLLGGCRGTTPPIMATVASEDRLPMEETGISVRAFLESCSEQAGWNVTFESELEPSLGEASVVPFPLEGLEDGELLAKLGELFAPHGLRVERLGTEPMRVLLVARKEADISALAFLYSCQDRAGWNITFRTELEPVLREASVTPFAPEGLEEEAFLTQLDNLLAPHDLHAERVGTKVLRTILVER